ncbi:MAG: serpin family protein [Tannerellaceae bacterium]|jgi:serpin B|nr:serpin family protein [Tannerellaceae bacterium]
MKKIIVAMVFICAGFLSCQKGELVTEVSENNQEQPKKEEPEKEDPAKEEPQREEAKPIDLTKAEQLIVQKNNLFAFDLLRTVSLNEEPEKNILLSPLSASLALAMLNNGAAGQTHDEIQQTLGYGDILRDGMNAYFQKMLTALQEVDPDVTLESANSIWIKDGFPVLDSFKETNRTYYAAEVRNEDFNNPATAGLINDWCAENTHDRIPDIIDKISPDAIMYLLNALYFKGVWTIQFDKQATADETFSNLDGTTPLLPTMNLKQTFYHAEGETFDLLDLPYGNEAFSMVILLPKEGVSLSSVIDALDAQSWDASLARMYTKEVELKLPRFKIECERILNQDLKDMGMISMFNAGMADFSLIRPGGGLSVSLVKQKTFAEVNEEGTEAAAVTVIEMVFTSIGEDAPPALFHVNRPFLYFIKEKSTGAILFTGVTKNLQ